MSDLTDLKHPLKPWLVTSLMVPDPELEPPFGLYLRNYIRLLDKALYERNASRQVVLAQIKSDEARAIDPTAPAQIVIWGFIDHFENCINAINRLLKQMDLLLNSTEARYVDRALKKKIRAFGKGVKSIRDLSEHIEKEIGSPEKVLDGPIMVSISESDDSVKVGTEELKFSDVAIVLRGLHEIGFQIVSKERSWPPAT